MGSPSSPGVPLTGGTDAPPRVGGRYVLRGELGRGGMATVHRARDEVLDRAVAVKLLHAHLARDPQFLDRFRREARAAAALAHPNVVAVHDWGETDEGPFLVLQLIDGPSLREVLRGHQRLLPAEAVAVLTPAGIGLGAAHDAGLVHRDVKPENLLLGGDGVVRVTDFGLARAAASATSTFGTDVLVGSPHYLSPEAVRGEPLDPRADVYALGVVLYEVLTGRPPFEGDSPFATAVQHTSRRVPPPSEACEDVPARLDAIVARATHPDRDRRYPDGRAFAAALDDAVPDQGATVPGLLAAARTGEPASTVGSTAVLPADVQDTSLAVGPAWLADPDDGPDDTDHGDDAASAALVVPPPSTAVPMAEPGGPPTPRPAADGDADTGEDPQVEDGHRGRRVLVAIAVVLALLGASAGAGYLLWDRVLAPVTAVPAVEGETEAAAVERLEAAGFSWRIAERRHDLDAPLGQVMEQDPSGPEASARQGATVALVISAGPAPVDLPDVSGEAADDAVATLEGLRLVVDRDEVFDDDVAEGLVVGTDPSAGETVDEGSTVQLRVSRGPAPIEVPDLRGLGLDEAQSTLRDLGLEAEVTSRVFSSDVAEGSVVAHTPEVGGELLPGGTVELVLSDGPEPIEVPNVRGQLRTEAVETLEDLGFVVEVETRDGFGAFLNPGRVFDQDPGPGAEAAAGDTITLFAYEG